MGIIDFLVLSIFIIIELVLSLMLIISIIVTWATIMTFLTGEEILSKLIIVCGLLILNIGLGSAIYTIYTNIILNIITGG